MHQPGPDLGADQPRRAAGEDPGGEPAEPDQEHSHGPVHRGVRGDQPGQLHRIPGPGAPGGRGQGRERRMALGRRAVRGTEGHRQPARLDGDGTVALGERGDPPGQPFRSHVHPPPAARLRARRTGRAAGPRRRALSHPAPPSVS